jgi:glycosyltransferase involved in cell wall biosynthesis
LETYRDLNTNKKLVIVGEGSFTAAYVAELKKIADEINKKEKVPGKEVIFTGALSGDALAELFSNAFLFVQPSESEGLSLALMEAMSYGCPVLASDIKENIEAVGSAGFTFKCGDVSDLAAKLNFLFEHQEEMAKKAKTAESRVFTEYNWDDLWKKIETVYKVAIEKKKSIGIFFRFFKYIRSN